MTEVTPHPLKTQGFHSFSILLFYDAPHSGRVLSFRAAVKGARGYLQRICFPMIRTPAGVSATDKPIRIPAIKTCISAPPTVPDRELPAMPGVMSATP